MTPALLLAALDVLAHVAPVLLLLALLMAGRYPGERAAVRRIPRGTARFRAGPPARVRRPRGPLVELPRGGALLPAGLAGRAPPVVPR